MKNVELKYGSTTHTGKVREENQDSLRVYEPDDPALAEKYGSLYALADGMGGYSHGSLASQTALEAFFTTFYEGRPHKSLNNLRDGVQTANLAVHQAAQRAGVLRMGTTLTAVNILDRHLYLTHVGDSRAYLIRDGQAKCLTKDHTVAGELVRMKLISPDKVRAHNQRSFLNKSLGIELFVQPDVAQVALKEDDLIVLCSDGVWSVIEDEEFADLTGNSRDLNSLSQTLIELAMNRESDDNVSALFVHVHKLEHPALEESNHNHTLSHRLRGWFTGKTGDGGRKLVASSKWQVA